MNAYVIPGMDWSHRIELMVMYATGINDIRKRTRKREVCKARQIAIYLHRKYVKDGLRTIALRYGLTNHGTVHHACTVVENLIITKDREYYPLIKQLDNQLYIQRYKKVRTLDTHLT